MKNAKEVLFHIAKWQREKERYIYKETGKMELSYRPSDTWLSYEQAASGAGTPIDTGTKWGQNWQYGWFSGKAVMPEEAAGKRVVLQLNFGGDGLIYVNGKLAGASDQQHPYIELTEQAAAGEAYEILAEAYAGHQDEQPVYSKAAISIVNESMYQFFIDLNVLVQLRNGLELGSLRVSEIDKGFRKLLAAIDWSVSWDELEVMALAGREIMRPLLECVNGSTVPKLFMMGQSHLDIAWLWPIEETKRKIARTFSNQLALLRAYPEYVYTQSQPYLFQMVKELYPELYEEIKSYIAAGRIIPEGGAWVEPDTNIPSGESLVRQFLYGKQFFREEFGTDSKLLWLPDVFGYSGNLPQIMKKSGVDYFASVKMYQTYENVVDPFPYNTFHWEGIDGSTVLTHLMDYGPFPNPADVSYALFQWNERIQKEDISTRLVQFGYGDGGGGANRDDLETLRRIGNLEGVPQTAITGPLDYFEDLQQRGVPDARYIGELYYPAHRGTFTSQARMKQGNRRGETALREAELWNTISYVRGKLAAYPQDELRETWKKLLLNQFHDILPGTSIPRVHEEADAQFAEIEAEASRIASDALITLTDKQEDVVSVFNSLAWERESVIELPSSWEHAETIDSKQLTIQTQGAKRFARVTIPALGSRVIGRNAGPEAEAGAQAPEVSVTATSRSLENSRIRVELNEYGEITAITTKETGTDWNNGFCNRFRMYRDQTSIFDAWEIDRRYEEAEMELPETASITVISEGPLFAAVRVERRLNQSLLTQEIYLEAGSSRVEFRTTVDWKEKNKLLKVGFDTNLHANEALHEIQFGYVKRPNHASRPHDGDRYEVNQHKWSALVEGNRYFALLNDCKYGLNVKGKQMNLTLLRAPVYPDANADIGIHQFTYALQIGHDGFIQSSVVRDAYELNTPVQIVPGAALEQETFLSCDQSNIIVDTIKRAEHSNQEWVVRLYESKGTSVNCNLAVSEDFAEVCETNMLEQPIDGEIIRTEGGIRLNFKPFEVKTIKFTSVR